MSSNNIQEIFPNIDLKNSLKIHFDKETLINKITSLIGFIPSYQSLKLDIELTKLVINIIEDELKNDKTTNKNDLLTTVLGRIFNLNGDELKVLNQQLEFLKNNKHIKGIPLSKKYIKSATRWITRRIA
jgi:hypothetical protein